MHKRANFVRTAHAFADSETLQHQRFLNPSNRLKTTKYNFASFLPIVIFQQFTKVVTLFFLANGILNAVPSISLNSPLAVLIPLAFVVCLGIIKEAIVEVKRWQEDRVFNSTTTCKIVRSESNFTNCKKRLDEIVVGDVIEVADDEQIPADCVVLWTKDERGKAYVQTAQLDGERTLKPKFAPLEIQTAFHDIFTRHSEPGWKFRIDSIAPSKDLYYFEGKITWNSGGKDSTCDVNLNQFLHRGATLRNSGKVYALVVHTGTETKQVMNFGEYQHKKPRFERFFNLVIGGNLILMLVLCAGLTLANRAWNENHHLTHEHIFFRSELTEITAKVFFSFLIMTSSLIALNVEVSLQIQKLAYAWFMTRDAQMTEPDFQTKSIKHCKVRNLNMIEELAEIEYVFCDKTGTLTQNQLVFREATVFRNNEISQDVESKSMFFKCVNLCHECIVIDQADGSANRLEAEVILTHETKNQTESNGSPEKSGRSSVGLLIDREIGGIGNKASDVVFMPSSNDNKDWSYSGPSTDEVCLLEMARKSGYFGFMRDRDSGTIKLQLEGGFRRFKILKYFAFTSDRMASSAVIEDEDGSLLVLVKGADSTMIKLSRNPNTKAIEKEVERFALNGMRTLVFGFRRTSLDELLADVNLDELKASDIERDLEIVAVTAVEDLLQERVAESILEFKEAGMKVWMLTGDKGTTAKMIAIRCGLIHKESLSTKFNGYDGPTEKDELFAIQESLKSQEEQHGSLLLEFQEVTTKEDVMAEIDRIKKAAGQKKFQLTIAGCSMATIVDNVDCQSEIGSLLLLADSVILYRSSPSQKAELLRMVKLLAKGRQICAVGDGANDVMMLQQADVGIGIMGKEGNQASQFADFAVTQFKDLRRLMFWHGSPFGGRIINFVNSILFKNFMIITTVVTNQFYCGFSGYFQIPDFLLAMFQINMTLILQACYVPFHKDMNFVKYPTPQSEKDLPFSLAQLYVTTQGHIRRFGADYTFNAAWAVFCGLFMHYQWEMVEREAIAGKNGLVLGADAFGVFCIISCALIADLWILRHIRHWDWLQVFLVTFSLFWIPFDLWKEQSMVTSKVTGLIYPLLAEPVYSLNIALIVAVTLLPLWVANRWRMVVVERIYFTE